MISRDLWSIRHPDAPMAVSYGPKAQVEDWRTRDPMRRGPDSYIVKRVPHCICCGSLAVSIKWADGWRCDRHANSTPCQVEGCKRTGARAKYSETICADHWRAGVPPGSAARKVWNRFHRIVKRFGWTAEREARSDRLWAWLKARCNAAARGDLDQREIDKLFGWDA